MEATEALYITMRSATMLYTFMISKTFRAKSVTSCSSESSTTFSCIARTKGAKQSRSVISCESQWTSVLCTTIVSQQYNSRGVLSSKPRESLRGIEESKPSTSFPDLRPNPRGHIRVKVVREPAGHAVCCAILPSAARSDFYQKVKCTLPLAFWVMCLFRRINLPPQPFQSICLPDVRSVLSMNDNSKTKWYNLLLCVWLHVVLLLCKNIGQFRGTRPSLNQHHLFFLQPSRRNRNSRSLTSPRRY